MSRETILINSFSYGRINNEKIKENVIKKKIVFAIKNWNDASDAESAK